MLYYAAFWGAHNSANPRHVVPAAGKEWVVLLSVGQFNSHGLDCPLIFKRCVIEARLLWTVSGREYLLWHEVEQRAAGGHTQQASPSERHCGETLHHHPFLHHPFLLHCHLNPRVGHSSAAFLFSFATSSCSAVTFIRPPTCEPHLQVTAGHSVFQASTVQVTVS